MSCPIQLSRPLNICQLHQSITDALGNLLFSSGSLPPPSLKKMFGACDRTRRVDECRTERDDKGINIFPE